MTAMTGLRRPGAERSRGASYDYELRCIAGFFASQAQARAAQQQMAVRHGVQPDQSQLLGPAQGAWLPFRRQVRLWSLGTRGEGRSGLSDAPLLATLAGVAAGLAMLIWLAVAGVPESPAVLLLPLAPLAGAALGWAVSALSATSASQRRFKRNIRRQLRAGRWVVLVHEMSLAQQAGATAVLRERGVGWCVLSAPWRRL